MSVIDVGTDEPVVDDESALWVDRTAEARELAEFILNAKDGLVVLYGRYAVGKTTLIKNYVMRVLPDDYETRFEDATEAIDQGLEANGVRISVREALESKRIIFLDRFERFLADSEDEPASLRSMSDFLRSPARKGILVLVMDDAGLEKVLAAAAYLPQLLGATRELHGIDIEHGCRALLDNEKAGALDYDSDFLERLSGDARKLTQTGGGGGPDLLMALVEELRNLAAEKDGACLTVALYEEAGGVDGLLNLYMDHRVAAMFPEDVMARKLAKALMVEIADSEEMLGERRLTDVSGRLGEPFEKCVEVQDKLIQESGLLSTSKNRPLQFVPDELRRVVDRLARTSAKAQEAHETVERGYDGWQRLGSPLPRERFEQVHSLRKELLLHQGFIEFLLHSIPADRERISESRYWLKRLRDREMRWEFLQEWLSSGKDELRLRAAGLGAEFPSERVPLLNNLAMEDSSEAVRSRALTMLMDIEGPEPLRERLEQEVQSGDRRVRKPALQALRLFHDERNRTFIRRQALSTHQPSSLRALAIETLAALDLPGAVDDLRRMAMQNQDPWVRQRATEALRGLRSKEAYEQLFTGVRETPSTVVDEGPPPGLAGVIGMVLKAGFVGILLVANLFLHGILLFAAGRYVLGILVFAIEGLSFWTLEELDAYEFAGPVIFTLSLVLGYILPLGKLLRARSTFKLRRRSFRSILCVVLFSIDFPIFLLVHGLAHLLLGRVGRAAALFAAEVAALGAFSIVYFLKPMFYIAGATGLTNFVIIAYLSAGAILFTISFALDWGVVAVRHVIFFRRVEGKRRRKALLRTVLAAPLAAETITDWAQGPEPLNQKWARGVLLEHAEQVPHEELVNLLENDNPDTQRFAIKSLARSKNDKLVKELTERWEKAKPQTSLAIRKIMSIKPTEASVRAFRDWKGGQGFREGLRYRMTRARFLYTYWPKSLMVVATLGLPLLMLLTYHAIVSYQTEASPLITFIVRNEDAGIELRVTVANFVADKYPAVEMTSWPRIEEDVSTEVRKKLKLLEVEGAATGDDEEGASRTVFDELRQVQKQAGSCYVKIGLVQSLGIAVSRLEEKRALTNRLTARGKRKIFAEPLSDILDQLKYKGCFPDQEKELALYETWAKNGNKGTKKALQALNTVVREVPQVFSGGSTHGPELARELQTIVNKRDKYHAADALKALIGIYLIRNSIDVQWDQVIDAKLQDRAGSELERARRRLIADGKNDAELDVKGIQARAAAAFAALGVELFDYAQGVEDSDAKSPLKAKSLEFLDRAFTLDDTVLDNKARAVMRGLREQNAPR